MLEGVAFQNIAQGHQRHFVVWYFDADITMSRHGRLNADARRGQRQRKVIRKRGDLADAHTRPPAARLDEKRLHAKLRDRRPAADLHDLRGCAKRCQRFLDQMCALFDEVFVVRRCAACIQDVRDSPAAPIEWQVHWG